MQAPWRPLEGGETLISAIRQLKMAIIYLLSLGRQNICLNFFFARGKTRFFFLETLLFSKKNSLRRAFCAISDCAVHSLIFTYCIVQNRFRPTRFRLGQNKCPQGRVLGYLYEKLNFAPDFRFGGSIFLSSSSFGHFNFIIFCPRLSAGRLPIRSHRILTIFSALENLQSQLSGMLNFIKF